MAQDTAGERQSVELAITPQDEPAPAFRYRLAPLDSRPGNAALNYYRALLLLLSNSNDFRHTGTDDDAEATSVADEIDRWYEVAPEDLDVDKVRELFRVSQLDAVLNELELGSTRNTCDWGYLVHERSNIFMMLLPELPAFRRMAKALALKVRLEIREGNYDEAVRAARCTLALGHDLGESPVLISGLVGLAITDITMKELMTMVERPDAPNLYWSLSTLPDPPADLRRAVAAEGRIYYTLFPELEEVATSQRSPEYWNVMISELVVEVFGLSGQGRPGILGPEAAAATLGLLSYADARRALIRDLGYSEDEVEAMATGRVLAIYFKQIVDKISSREMKAFVAGGAVDRAGDPGDHEVERDNNILQHMASLLYAAMGRVRTVMMERQTLVAEYRLIEAIRMYTAVHGGKVPPSLDALRKLVPVPDNPLTGEPFGYHVTDAGISVDIAAGVSSSRNYPKRYVLRIAP